MRDQGRILINKHEDQTTNNSNSMIYPSIRGLTEKKDNSCLWMTHNLGQFVNDSTQKHGLAFPRIPFDPKKMTFLLTIGPSIEIRIIKHPHVCVLQQSTLGSLNPLFIEARIGRMQSSKAGTIF
jgi:hypothetical protein